MLYIYMKIGMFLFNIEKKGKSFIILCSFIFKSWFIFFLLRKHFQYYNCNHHHFHYLNLVLIVGIHILLLYHVWISDRLSTYKYIHMLSSLYYNTGIFWLLYLYHIQKICTIFSYLASPLFSHAIQYGSIFISYIKYMVGIL